MSLLRPRRKRATLRSSTVIRCPFNGHQVSFCRGLCVPTEGIGFCGRLAPHSMLGRHQEAILRYKERPPTRG